MASEQVSLARLPATAAELFGREGDLAWLEAAWREGAHVATVVAWGGVGKTSLVNRWLAGVRDRKWEGAKRVWGWSFYSGGTGTVTSSDVFIAKALEEFGDPDPMKGSAWDKGERLAKLVRKHKTILILDGLEPLQWGPGVQEGRLKDPALQALLKELAAQNSGLCVVTSRIGLADLDGLSGDKVRALDLRNLSPEAGAALLKKKGVKGTDGELQEASSEYKGHSLALTLLGAYLTEVAEGDIRRRREIGPLEAEETQGGHARRVMKSYESLLGRPEAAILHMLGLFDRPAEEGELAALRADPIIRGLTDGLAGIRRREWNKAIARLRKIGLLLTEQDKRLDAHPLVREHFGEQLKREQPEAFREGHRRLYKYLKEKAKEYPENVEEMAPLYAAVVHGCLAGRSAEARAEVLRDRIRRGAEGFSWRKLGAFGSEVAVFSAFFDPPWERLAPGLSEAAQAWILNAAGFALRALGRLSEAAGLMRLGVDLRVAQENWENAAIAASNLSELLLTHGELSEAEAQARRSVDFADRSGDAFQRMARRTTLAAAQHARGLGAEAAALFEEAERIQEEWPSAYPRLYSLWGFRYCDLLLDQGRDAEVRERAAQTLEWVQHTSWLLDIALDHLSLGRAHLLGVRRGTGGDLAKSTSHLQQAVDGLRRAGQDDLPLGLLARAALHLHNRAFDLARRDLHDTLSLATRCEFRLHEADAHLGLTRLALAERDPARAQTHLEAARDIIAKTGYHRREGELEALHRACREEEKERRGAEAPRRKKAKKQTTSRDGGASGQGHGKTLAPPRPRASAFFSSPPSDPTATPPGTQTMTKPTETQPVDIGIVIALQEELRVFLDLARPYQPHPDRNLDSYLFSRGNYRCAVTFVGAMGESQAGVFTERLIATLDPDVLVSMGISGGLNDLLAGDVHIPEQAVQYLQDSKAMPDESGGFTIIPGAPAYRVDFALFRAIRSLEFRHPTAHEAWVAACAADFATLLPDAPERAALLAAEKVREKVRALSDGHVATGPVVGGSQAFSGRIRSHDRQIKSIEMESAAVLLAAQNRDNPKRAITIRGISDFGDEHKKELDKKGDGVLRRYAMRNAVRFLFTLLDVEAFPQNPR